MRLEIPELDDAIGGMAYWARLALQSSELSLVVLLRSNVGGSENSCCHDDFFWQVSECFHDHRLYVACQTLKVMLTILKITNC
ncbi:MAG: hypothetical protein OSB73_24120, partial [Candidatus Latescibacteria bacterium]|nr:hypothetical protein [Candidatus Latescibacterota bacterium]